MNTAQAIAHRAPIYGRAAVRLAIAAGVLIFCLAADSARLAYDLGRLTGEAVHARNDQLAAVFRAVLAPANRAPLAPVNPAPLIGSAIADAPLTAAERAIEAMRPHATPEVLAHLAGMVMSPPEPPLPLAHSLTVRELRALTGRHSKRLKRADLVSCALANGLAA